MGKEPGLDNRHRDKDGTIQKKRSDTLNKNLPKPIPEFPGKIALCTVRKKQGKKAKRRYGEKQRNCSSLND